VSEPSPARARRPWYLTVALYALCIIGASGMSAGCNDLDYLRGSQALPDIVSKTLDAPSSPFIRTGMLREQARLQALAHHHELSFPINVARLLLSILLLAAASACLLRRRGSRKIALQAIAANFVLALIAFRLLAPVHEAMAQALAVDAVDNLAVKSTAFEREASIEEYHDAFIWLDGFRFVVFELGSLLGIAFALTRPTSIAMLQPGAQERPQDDGEGHP